jgi:tetratricopeptide (TPR) repeat protein
MNMAQAQLHFATGLWIVCIAGSLGGLISGIGAMVESGLDDTGAYLAIKGVPVWFFLLGRCVVGIGGATAVLLASLSVNKFTGSSDIDLLALSALCFVAGSIGYRLLPMVAAQLEKRLGEAERKVDRAVKEVEQNKGEIAVTRDEANLQAKLAVSMASQLVEAFGYLENKDFSSSQTEKLINSMSSLLEHFPTNRPLNILLSRLWEDAAKNRQRAMQVLRAYVEEKTKIGQGTDTDVATAYWNLANYYEFDFKKTQDMQYRKEAIRALSKALEISPAMYLDDLSQDPDFGELAASEEGQKLMRDFGSDATRK